MAEPLLRVQGLTKTFPVLGGLWRRPVGLVEAVRDVTCELREGEALGLVGESGCGKSTLARLLLGLLTPTSGEVRIAGQSWPSLRGAALREARRRIQLVFQDPTGSLNPLMTVDEILSEPLCIHSLASGAAERRRRVEELLALVQLPAAHCRRLPRQLSGGERQRVGIARALSVEPQILVCDEPIASLDVSVGAGILLLLRELRRRRRLALVFISHDLGAVASMCERTAIMRQGRLVQLAPTPQLLERPEDPYTQLLVRCAFLDLSASASQEA